MSDVYRPSGPKSSKPSAREHERAHDHELDYELRGRAYDRDGPDKSYHSKNSNSSSYKGGRDARDYYAPPAKANNDRRYQDHHDYRDRDRDREQHRRDDYGPLSGGSGARNQRGGPPKGPPGASGSNLPRSGRENRDTRPLPANAGRKLPTGPRGGSENERGGSDSAHGGNDNGAGPHSGSSAQTGAHTTRFRPAGPSGYKDNSRDTYRPSGSGTTGAGAAKERKALPPQESTRPLHISQRHDSYASAGSSRPEYKKRKYDYNDGYNDGYNGGYGGSGSGQGRDSYQNPRKVSKNTNGGYRSGLNQHFGPHSSHSGPHTGPQSNPHSNTHSNAISHSNSNSSANVGPKGKSKKERRFLKPSQIYLLKMMKPKEIYGRVQQVGEGTYGKVYKAQNLISDEFVALKKLRLESEREGFPITAIREIKLLQSFEHENVVGLLEMMVEQNQIYMVFDYMDHDLTGLLIHPDMKLQECHRKFIFKQLLEGLNYIHKKRVIHRDIKGSNILINNYGVVKIADFGLARTMKTIQNGELPDYTNRVITIWYRPPELLLGATDYGREVDIWGIGCLLIELYTKLAAFQGQDEVSQLQKIFSLMGTPTLENWPTMNELPWFEMLKPKVNKASNFHKEYSSKLSELSFDLVLKLLEFDPKKRFTAEEALKHAYFVNDPQPEPLYFLKDLKGEWHEFETKKRRRMERKRLQEIKSEQPSIAST